ncbi:Promoter of filamentation protein-like protein [Hapsidospora chrysogenum ATCC 11550]|uniref:Promoter of filamentation protein-like protein n=1 Tax=Hapsidospora chrysogenum (strain ATCC 11550 / CBS 779.69 / DSM 880 / IAM 14645 / JCM 23072 / IMI 49137) TaxID=857340 RepID=A0A086TGI2_HAPC1|nr:Promoter of filamentation protein-like protein [Hapsidospora chrysogenum ATCC 11550]
MSTPNNPPAMPVPDPRALVDFFARSLTSFTSSSEPFRVLCTLPHLSNNNSHPPSPRPQQQHPAGDIIVLDSSFNPPTTAHASMVRTAVSSPRDRVLLLLAVENADKAPRPASFPLRLCMMEALGRELVAAAAAAAAQGHGGEVDVGVTRKPYFHDKARAIAESGFYGGGSDITFLAGYDTLVRILEPAYYGGSEGMRAALDPFFDRARLRVTMRTDGKWGGREEQEAYVKGLAEEGGKMEEIGGRREWMRRVELVDGFGDGVSSSRVREVVRMGGSGGVLDGLVGEEVRGWVEREALYNE